MNPINPCPHELDAALGDLRVAGRISAADAGRLRKRLAAGAAQEINLELFRNELISSRCFDAIERAIRRDTILEADASPMHPVTDRPRRRAV